MNRGLLKSSRGDAKGSGAILARLESWLEKRAALFSGRTISSTPCSSAAVEPRLVSAMHESHSVEG